MWCVSHCLLCCALVILSLISWSGHLHVQQQKRLSVFHSVTTPQFLLTSSHSVLLSVTELVAEGVDMSFLLHCWKLSCQVKEWYVKLAVCRPSKENGVAGSEKKKIGFCIMQKLLETSYAVRANQSLIYNVYILINFVSFSSLGI